MMRYGRYMYNKLFTKILDSSIWLEPMPTRIVWLTFIASMDEQGFCQFASVGNVAARARVTLKQAEQAIECLENPDPDSSDKDNEGRRIERMPGGWLVLNAEKYRKLVTRVVMQEQTRERVRRYRERQRGDDEAVTDPLRESNAPVTPSDTDTDTDTEADARRARDLPQPIPRIATGPHRSHAFCSFACVPAFLHEEFRRGLNRADEDEADMELRKGYLAHMAAWPKGKPTGDAVRFWRAWYAVTYPVERPKDAEAIQRKLGPSYGAQDWYADCHHEPKCDTGPMHRQRVAIDAAKQARGMK